MIRDFFKEYFAFSKSERNGAIVLLVIIVLLIVAVNLLKIFKTEEPVDFSSFEDEIDEFVTALKNDNNAAENKISITEENEYGFAEDSLFYFDPNTATIEDWQKLGFSAKQASVMQKYISKGGRFFKKEDLKKMYLVTEEIYSRLEPFINIADIAASSFQKGAGGQAINKDLFEFDPNRMTTEEWQRLGLSEKQALSIKKYQDKGGKFYKKDDLRKMYCITDELYNTLEPYIHIEHAEYEDANEYQEQKSVELNSADSSDLVNIKGIGSYFARSIINYRNKLGGFINKQQLLEVYNFSEEIYMNIEKNITVDPSLVRKMDVNTADIKQLGNHPYMDWKYAKEVVRHREKNGAFSAPEEILINYLMPEKAFSRVSPYLTVGDEYRTE